MNNPIISLCIPTNGVIEWIFPVLESIYNQNCNWDEFEVVITDNGIDKEFKNKIKKYAIEHTNLQYFETTALPFMNEIESYKRAQGQLIKFVNHRTLLRKGVLQSLIDLTKANIEKKPILYFSNGVLKKKKESFTYNDFDQFLKNLSFWSSWSTGMTIWKDDFDKLIKDINNYNELFPHTNILFSIWDRETYIIDNSLIFDEIPQGKKPKGNYDLYFAFGIEYPAIICDLLRSKKIKNETFRYILDKNLEFISSLYYEYNIKKKYCSYDLSGLEDIYGVFYTKHRLYGKVFKYFCKKIGKKILRG